MIPGHSPEREHGHKEEGERDREVGRLGKLLRENINSLGNQDTVTKAMANDDNKEHVCTCRCTMS